MLAKQGQVHFGENYVQEALEKIEKLKDLGLQWHLIGPLQKNKVKFLKKYFFFTSLTVHKQQRSIPEYRNEACDQR